MTHQKSTVRGWKFFLQLAGGALLAGIAFFIIAAIFLKALFAWGILGFFLFLVVVALIGGWYADYKAKRERAKYDD